MSAAFAAVAMGGAPAPREAAIMDALTKARLLNTPLPMLLDMDEGLAEACAEAAYLGNQYHGQEDTFEASLASELAKAKAEHGNG